MQGARVVLMGVSGCGKSSVGVPLARRLEVPFLEGDSLHSERNISLMSAGVALTDEDRRDWLDAIAERLGALGPQEGLVVACSALKRGYRDRLRRTCPDVRFVYLKGDAVLIERRLTARRGHYMPPALLASQFEALEPPQSDENIPALDIVRPVDALVAQILQHLQEPAA